MTRRDWLLWRRQGIGSSDAASIMGTSAFMTELELYEEKISSDEPDEGSNFVMDLGNEVEPRVRSLFSMIMDKDFQVKLLQMEAYPFIRASLDGIDDDSIIEIKLSGKEDWALRDVPEKYYAQVQHQLMVSGAKICYFLSYQYADYVNNRSKPLKKECLSVVEVSPNPEYIEKLMAAEVKFWRENVLKRKPPLPSGNDYVKLKGAKELVEKWKELKIKSEEIETELESVRNEILELAKKEKHPRLICNGVTITQESRIGSVDYSKVPELKDVDLNQYRKNGSTSWKILNDKKSS